MARCLPRARRCDHFLHSQYAFDASRQGRLQRLCGRGELQWSETTVIRNPLLIGAKHPLCRHCPAVQSSLGEYDLWKTPLPVETPDLSWPYRHDCDIASPTSSEGFRCRRYSIRAGVQRTPPARGLSPYRPYREEHGPELQIEAIIQSFMFRNIISLMQKN